MKKRMDAIVLVSVLVVAGLATTALAVGTPAGMNITNQATVDYEDGNGNSFTELSNVVTTTVSQVAAVQTAPDNSSNATPSDVVYYAHTVTNLGNGSDLFDMTTSSSQGWSVTIYEDVNGNGVYDSGTDVVLSDTDADTTPDTGSLAADDSLRIIVAVTVPGGAADGTVDVTTVTATSDFNGAVTDDATDTTTVQSPDVTVSKSVSPAGAQAPGATLTYTIVVANGGTGSASNVLLTDPIPANTTYVVGSITQDAAARTDAGGDDNADYNVTNPGEVTVSIGALAVAGSTTIEFQVTID
jgi:uncharacterized repeat protein (TIGR01451 family)